MEISSDELIKKISSYKHYKQSILSAINENDNVKTKTAFNDFIMIIGIEYLYLIGKINEETIIKKATI